jgi:hypothetical protein
MGHLNGLERLDWHTTRKKNCRTARLSSKLLRLLGPVDLICAAA